MSHRRAAIERIAAWLHETAIRHEDRVTWVGARPVDPFTPTSRTFATLGPDLYGGTSGVALFLLALSEYGVHGYDELARAALRHAVRHVDGIPQSARLGAYSGLPGVLWVLSATDPTDPAVPDLLTRIEAALEAPGDEFDVIGGLAGAVVALLAAAPRVGDRAVSGAVLAGRLLRDQAVTGAGTLRWPQPDAPRNLPLTGLSHGAAGAGLAFAELAAVTGETVWKSHAYEAFAFEREWYDAAERNWPDLREVRRVRSGQPLPYATLWCHGSAGIALTRARAADLLADAQLRQEARIAAETTARWVAEALHSPATSASLCHGLAGNGEVLLTCARMLDQQSFGELGDLTADYLASLNPPQDLANGDGESPGLMLGWSGIGSFLLAAEGARPRSPLLLSL